MRDNFWVPFFAGGKCGFYAAIILPLLFIYPLPPKGGSLQIYNV